MIMILPNTLWQMEAQRWKYFFFNKKRLDFRNSAENIDWASEEASKRLVLNLFLLCCPLASNANDFIQNPQPFPDAKESAKNVLTKVSMATI